MHALSLQDVLDMPHGSVTIPLRDYEKLQEAAKNTQALVDSAKQDNAAVLAIANASNAALGTSVVRAVAELLQIGEGMEVEVTSGMTASLRRRGSRGKPTVTMSIEVKHQRNCKTSEPAEFVCWINATGPRGVSNEAYRQGAEDLYETVLTQARKHFAAVTQPASK